MIKKNEDQILESINPLTSSLRKQGHKKLKLESSMVFSDKSSKFFLSKINNKKNIFILTFLTICFCIINFSKLFGYFLTSNIVEKYSEIKPEKNSKIEISDEEKNQLIEITVFCGCSFLLIPFVHLIIKQCFSKKISKIFHKKIIENIFNSDVYILEKEIPKNIYNLIISQDVDYIDQIIPKEISKILDSISLILSIGISTAIIINPYLLIPPIIYFIFLFLLIKNFFKGRGEFKEMKNFLKLKHNEMLQDVMEGLNTIRAGKMQIYFKVKLSVFLERLMMVSLYIEGSRYKFKFNGLLLALFTVFSSFWGFVYAMLEIDERRQEKKVSIQDLVYFLALVVMVCLTVERMAGCMESVDKLFFALEGLKNGLMLTNFDPQSKVNFFYFFLIFCFFKEKIIKEFFKKISKKISKKITREPLEEE